MTMDVPPGGTYGKRVPKGSLASVGGRMFGSIIRLSGGRIGGEMMLLTTVGAKSGKRRTTPVRRIPDGDDRWLAVASANGSAHHPAWLHNMVAHPDQIWIEIGNDTIHVHPEIMRGDERAAAWDRIVAEAPQFGSYPSITDREMPVVLLTRAE